MMKKIGIIVVFVLVIFVLINIFFGGLGWGTGNGTGEDSGTERNIENTFEDDEKEDDANECETIMISVVKDDYFYENERISLEDFVALLQEKDGDCIVNIKDDAATKDAYDKLINELETLYIEYIEE